MPPKKPKIGRIAKCRDLREKETSEERLLRLAADAERKRKARSTETPAERHERLAGLRTTAAQARSRETSAKRHERLAGLRTTAAQARSRETSAERHERLEGLRRTAAQARSIETAEQRNQRLATKRRQTATTRASESADHRQERLSADSARHQNLRKLPHSQLLNKGFNYDPKISYKHYDADMISTVKNERHDDQEITEMARKLQDQYRSKAAMQLGVHPQVHPQLLAMQMARPGQPTIPQYMSPGRSNQLSQQPQQRQQQTSKSGVEVAAEKKVDLESKKGRFGWCEFEKNHIPYIFRSNNEKYTSVRMVERKFLSQFLAHLPPEVNSCHCIRSYYITDSESKLFNEINNKHSEGFFGKEPFTTKDLVVRLRDAKEFYRFLDLCYKKLVLKKSNTCDRCGFFRINDESVVPYTVREKVKYVPLFYFEGETDHLKLKSDQVEGWDLAYLKFCCKVQGIRNELFAADVCRVVALDEIKGHFPQGTTFEDYWPAKGSIEPVNAQRTHAGNWTQKPPSAMSATQMPLGNGRSGLSGHSSQQQQQSQQHLNRLQSHPSYTHNRQQPANPYESSMLTNSNYQQLMRAATLSHHLNNAFSNGGLPHAHNSSVNNKQFPAKLTQIKEFPVERSNQLPYKLQKALIDQKIVPCINVRPFVFHDLMMTMPDFVKHFCPELSMERSKQMLQKLNVILYKGNKGHQDILRQEGKCQMFDPVPLVLVKDIMSYMPQIKYAASLEQSNKRMRVS